MKLNFITNPVVKKSLGVASIIFTGVVAISDAAASRKREQEFEELKKAVSELTKK